ncbi:collagen-like protein [Mucilaginibacter rigui]|uniref:Collagen-like protein n=1 Tax=Mucilaginibacter rigui TaxID=534635 RepID=A0ABR7X078_9SPHI|nr:collagen-like protein [Mucilaginibacter rigui]MBD1383980.1 collagen-like protein [Mucilaginibacter rigui]
MATDKKISELPVISTIAAADVSLLVRSGTDYQYNFTTLLEFIQEGINPGANISFGTTLPQNTNGKNGDVFINTSAGSFALKQSGTWSVKYTLPISNGSDSTVLYGSGVPGSSIGSNNDTYINIDTGIFYHKASGTWTQVFSMQTGPQGPKGDKGDTGTTGANGKTILNGTSNPSNSTTGTNGDFYLNTNTYQLFGPKTGGEWGLGTSIIGLTGEQGEPGPQGEDGPSGEPGVGVATGGTTGQVLSKLSDADFDTGWVDAAEGGNLHAPNGIISGLELSVSGGNVTVAAGSWRINNNVYQILTSTNLVLAAADGINNRIDLIYADVINTIALLTGTTSANPVKPSLPFDCIEVGFALVTPSGSETTPAPGAEYLTRSQFIDTIGDKSQLSTAAKNNLVDAINEVSTSIGSINQESVILKIFKKSNYR